MSKPPRSAMTLRDMAAAVGVLALIVLLFGGLTRGCSFAPAGPTVDPGAAPTVDAPARLAEIARDVPFPLAVPALPAGWRATSVGRDRVGDGSPAQVVRVGYLTASGTYLRLLQSDAPEEGVLRVETGTRPVPARGPVDVGGKSWVAYGEPDGRAIWIGDRAGVRFLITGDATEAQYREFATALATAPNAPR